MKKFWITLLSVLTLVCCAFGVAACKSNDVLATYTLKENGSLVYEDFELPNKIADKSVSWTSDNAAITVEARKGENYLAKVTLGDEAVPTKLTVKAGGKTKDFTVTVGALDVSYFVQKFVFENENATVFADFELPTTFTLLGKTASIKWSVEREADKALISVVEEGGKTMCKVNQSSLNPDVRLYAEFEYNGVKQKTNFRMTVSFERTHIEEVDYWYYNTGVSIKMSGYVVAIGTAYSESYENVTLYMVDDDFCAGYYLYRVKASKEDGALLEPGVHVTVTGTTNTNYNGLIETNAGGNLVVDKDVEKITVAEHVYALDNDLLANSREAVYHTSSLVSLTNWKVKSMYKSAPTEGATSTLFTLEKGGVEVSVAISKYMEGVYATKESDETYKGLADLYTSIKAGDVVSVTGILGNYNGFQIIPMKADDVKKAAEGTEASAVPEACTKVASAIEKVEKAFKDEGISSVTLDNKLFKSDSGFVITADKEIEIPTVEGVEIKPELIHGSGTVKVENGKLIVTVGSEDMASLQVTYTVKDGEGKTLYTTRTFHIVHSMKMNDQDIVEKLRFDFVQDVEEIVVGEVELTTSVKEFPSATISWALKAEVEGVTVADNKLTVAADLAKDRTAVLVATFKSGEGENAKEVTKEYTVKIPKAVPFKAGTYKLAVEQKKLNKTLYFTGEITSSNFGAASEFYIEAVDVVVAEVVAGSTYTLKVGDKYLELNDSHRLALVETKTGEWTYNYSLKVFTWTVTAEDNKIYYLGTYGEFDTISASETWRISGENASAVGDSQFVAFFEEPKQLSEAEIAAQKKYQDAQKALNAIGKFNDITEAGSIDLPASTIEGVTLAWALAEDNKATSAALADGKLTVATMPEATETVTLTATATCGDATRTKTFTITVKVETVLPTPDNFEEGTYKICMDLTGHEDAATTAADIAKKYYFIGELTSNGNFGETTTAIASAADVLVTAVPGGYTFKVVSSNKYIELVINGTYVNFGLVDTASTSIAWVYDEDLGTFTWTNEKGTYCIGTYKNAKTAVTNTYINASFSSYISGDNKSKIGVTQFPVQFVKYTPPQGLTDEQKVDAAIEELSLNTYVQKTGEINLPTNPDVTITWSSDNTEYIEVVDNAKLNVKKLTAEDAEDYVQVTITASVNSGDVTKPKTFSLTIDKFVNYGTKEAPLSVTAALAIAATQCASKNQVTAEVVYMTGVATDTPVQKTSSSGAVYYQTLHLADPADSTKSILVYSFNLRDDVEAPIQNDTVVVCGYIKNYDGTIEFASNGGTNVYAESTTRGTSTITLTVAAGQATVTDLPESATNGTEVTFTVAATTGYELVAVKVNEVEIEEDEDNAGSYTITVTGNMEVTVETKVYGSATPTYVWTKVTNVNQLTDGAKIIIACGKYAMGGQNSTFRDSVAFDVNNPSTDVVIVTLEKVAGSESDFYLKVGTEGYLTPSAAKKISATAKDATNSKWTITVEANGSITITNANSTFGTLQYNSSSPRFLNYTSNQTAPEIYVQTESTPAGGTTEE